MARKNGLGLVWCVISYLHISDYMSNHTPMAVQCKRFFVLFAVCRIDDVPGNVPGNESLMRARASSSNLPCSTNRASWRSGPGQAGGQGRRHIFYIVNGSLRFPNPLKKIFKIFKLSIPKLSIPKLSISNFQYQTPTPNRSPNS